MVGVFVWFLLLFLYSGFGGVVIGDCYFFPAQIIVEENAKLAIDDPKYNENENKIKELYEKAKPYYEKAKELKPDNKVLWGNYLLNIYWKYNRAEYDSLEKELGF